MGSVRCEKCDNLLLKAEVKQGVAVIECSRCQHTQLIQAPQSAVIQHQKAAIIKDYSAGKNLAYSRR